MIGRHFVVFHSAICISYFLCSFIFLSCRIKFHFTVKCDFVSHEDHSLGNESGTLLFSVGDHDLSRSLIPRRFLWIYHSLHLATMLVHPAFFFFTSFPPPHFPPIFAVVKRCSSVSLLITWPKKIFMTDFVCQLLVGLHCSV